MILDGRTPARLSRTALVAIALLGVAFLPLLPTTTKAEGAAEKAVPPPDSLDQLVRQHPSCLACHEPARPVKRGEGHDDLHDRVVRLLNDHDRLRQQLKQTEAQLKDVLRRLDKKAPADTKDRQLEEIQKKLRQLLDEVESLRRERKPAAPPRPAGKPAPVSYLPTRTVHLPVRTAGTNVRWLLLLASDDRGKTWKRAAQVRPDSERITFNAPADGRYWFCVVPLEGLAKEPDPRTQRPEPQVEVIIDTTAPVLRLAVGPSGNARCPVEWSAEDENLDASSFRLEYRGEGETDWTDLKVPPSRRGKHELAGNRRGGAVRARIRDLAGNDARLTVKVP